MARPPATLDPICQSLKNQGLPVIAIGLGERVPNPHPNQMQRLDSLPSSVLVRVVVGRQVVGGYPFRASLAKHKQHAEQGPEARARDEHEERAQSGVLHPHTIHLPTDGVKLHVGSSSRPPSTRLLRLST